MRRRARPPRSRSAQSRSSSGCRRGASSHGYGAVPEPVAGSADGEDELGIARVALDLLAQMADVDVDRPRLAVVGAPADPLEQLPSREDDARLGSEQREELELDERQLDRRSAYLDRAPWQ